jgi:hypothetical protein
MLSHCWGTILDHEASLTAGLLRFWVLFRCFSSELIPLTCPLRRGLFFGRLNNVTLHLCGVCSQPSFLHVGACEIPARAGALELLTTGEPVHLSSQRLVRWWFIMLGLCLVAVVVLYLAPVLALA